MVTGFDVARRVLVLFAHPALEASRVNRRLVAAARGVAGITVRDLYELYPDYDVDVSSEQAALLAHDVYVFQHPLYWYSVPPLVKQWLDLVLEHGWAYGPNGHALRGKRVIHAITAGGGEAAYQADGTNRFTVTELLRPLEQTAVLCNMAWLPPFVAHGTHRMRRDEMDAHAADYRRLLEALRDDAFDEDAARQFPRVNAALDTVIRPAVPAKEAGE
ncbi:MAG TPA: NAD(P)H-dependent oxidoreductase [Polyangiaceae bacterium LLY-WYZ-14_1]|nr:NAD(P)H-dependent oxidoreductase [Polyangiaceae bacterium LLY-WYZ-14_1]